MTAHELGRLLLNGPDLPVHQSYPYGDYWHTQVASEVTETVEGMVKHSDYHRMDKVIVDEEDEDECKGGRRVVLLY